jgi:iron complex transport system permease protein
MAGLCIAEMIWGSVQLPLGDLWTFCRGGYLGGASAGILQIRSDRLLLAIITGGALSGTGVTLQALLGNPLADPYILGTSSGAACGAALALYFGVTSALTLPIYAFAGAIASTLLVFAIARAGGGNRGERLLLSGIIVGFLGSALIMLLMTWSDEMLQDIVAVLMGSLDFPFTELSRRALNLAAATVAIGSLLLISQARVLDAWSLGEQGAFHLGISVERTRLSLLALAALLIACVVSFTGLIGFVGLVVPHTLRLLVGPSHRRLLPLAMMGGSTLLIGADLLAHTIAPAPLPVGVVTALLGGPFFLYLLVRSRRIR